MAARHRTEDCGLVVDPVTDGRNGGADDGTRTRNRRFTKPLLYQLSYVGATGRVIPQMTPSAPGNDRARRSDGSSVGGPRGAWLPPLGGRRRRALTGEQLAFGVEGAAGRERRR